MEQREWLVSVVVRATEAEVAAIGERIGEVICVPPDHDEKCATPWAMRTLRVSDLDEPERSDLIAFLDA